MKSGNRKAPGKRESKKVGAAKRGKQHAENQASTRIIEHPLYGDVPLIPEYYTYPSGNQATSPWWVPDPNFRPKLPPNAVPGDPSKQDFCTAHYLPHYFYLDEERVCVQCGKSFLFTAHEQKFWYETLKFNFSSTAIRCRSCRRQRRTGRALHQQLAAAVELVMAHPDDPVALVTLARSTAEYHHHHGKGNLERGIAAARKARKIAPALHEAWYWEGVCQEAAGRGEKAHELYDTFIAAEHQTKRYRSLVQDALSRRDRLAANAGQATDQAYG